jgi:hypothetical protein
MQAREKEEVSVLRSAIAALGNAEAVRPEPVRLAEGVYAAEASRRELTAGDEQAVLRSLHQELLEGAGELQQLGEGERAEALRRQAEVVARYLD